MSPALHDYQRVSAEAPWKASCPFQQENNKKFVIFDSECGVMEMWKVDEKWAKICSMHLLLLCEVRTMISYLWMESLLVLCAVTPLGAKVQRHATRHKGWWVHWEEGEKRGETQIGSAGGLWLAMPPPPSHNTLWHGMNQSFILLTRVLAKQHICSDHNTIDVHCFTPNIKTWHQCNNTADD